MDNIIVDKRMLEQWLKSGYVDRGCSTIPKKVHLRWNNISNFVMLMTLAGIEQQMEIYSSEMGARANFIGYADDFWVPALQRKC